MWRPPSVEPPAGDETSLTLKSILVALVAALIGAATVWSVLVLFDEPQTEPSSTFTTATAKEGEVGASITLNTVATWGSRRAGINRASGVVTRVGPSVRRQAQVGDILYWVDLKPVVVARGATPSFRSLSVGSNGDDVRQLQGFLRELGYPVADAPGNFGTSTAHAVQQWQGDIEATVDGVVGAGDIIYLASTFPRAIVLKAEVVAVGATVTGGETVLSVLSESPTFVMPVTDTQAAVMPTGTAVIIDGPNGSRWRARAESQSVDTRTSQINIRLVAPRPGRPICRSQCGQLPVTRTSSLPSRVITVKTVRGLVIPVAAISSDNQGLSVTDETGRRRTISILASADGLAVVEGLTAGERVRIGPDS